MREIHTCMRREGGRTQCKERERERERDKQTADEKIEVFPRMHVAGKAAGIREDQKQRVKKENADKN